MPRVCTVCQHVERAAIDEALVRGVAYRVIARQFDLGKDALGRHHAEHLPALLLKGQAAAEMSQADRLLADVRGLRETAYRLLLAAEAAGDLKTALLGVREARGCLELLAKLSGELDERPQLNLVITPEWHRVRAALLAALGPYPEARAAVATRLMALESSRGEAEA